MSHTYEITTAANFFYTKTDTLPAFYFKATLTENIDGAILQESATLTMQRFPYFATKLEVSDSKDRYVMRTNNAPFLVSCHNDFLPLDNPKANEYMITVAYDGATLYFLFFHGLTDGMGGGIFVQTLLHTYLSKKSGRSLACPGVMNIHEEADPSEYFDPYENLKSLDYQHFKMDTPFSFAEDEIDTTQIKLHALRVPKEHIVRMSKHTEGSISGLFALILSRAIARKHPDITQPIVISCPFDLRKMLSCERTLRNCNQSVKYVYSNKMKKYPLEQQMSLLKGMLYAQMTEEHQMPRYLAMRDKLIDANRTATIAEKQDIYTQNSGLASVPIVSYLGELVLGDCAEYIADLVSYSKVSGAAGMLFGALCIEDECVIRITSNLKSDVYFEAFLAELEACGIPYTLR
ncbi:MAG: hypothetical protein R3Y53_06195 [Bacillota bacterium]